MKSAFTMILIFPFVSMLRLLWQQSMEQTYLVLLDILQNYYNQIILHIAFPNINNNSYRPTLNITCLSRQQYAV